MKTSVKFLLLMLSFILLMYLYEVRFLQPKMVWMGIPKVQGSTSKDWLRILRNDAYLLAYSETKKNALWVSYKVSKKPKPSRYTKRPKNYKVDWRSFSAVNAKNFKRTGYDRGHLAPNYAIGSRFGRKAQLETFLMTNISPQKPTLNRKLWQRLEELVTGYFSKRWGTIWVMTGPIFDKEKPTFLNNTKIQIPKAFYKILIRPNDNLKQVYALAFVMPQNVKGNENLQHYVTTIDDVEQLTGLDFFNELPPKIETILESKINTDKWSLSEVASRPSRY